MIDPSIPLMAKGIDGLQMLDDGNKLAQLWQGQKTNAEMNRIYKQAGGDQGKMMELGQNSALMHLVMPQLKAQQAAQQKALMDQQKAQADISKTNSEAFKNNQQGSGFGFDNGQKQLGAINSAIQQASMTGDKAAAIIGLDAARRVGLVSSDDYNQHYKVLNAMTPEEVKSYAQSVTFANAKDPASIAFQTANNVADNETSIANNVRDNKTSSDNNVRTTQASIYNTDKDYQLGQQGLQIDQQKAYFEQNKPLDFQVGNDGYQYAIYPNGKGVRVIGNDGQPIKMQSQKPMSATTQKELFEVGDSITASGNAITNLRDALKYSANAYDGVGAIQRAKAMGHVSNDESARNTVLLDNIVSGNALETLKATFGGAPTEGERKILLDLQGSANLPRDQREAIYTRAIAAAERRLAINEEKAQGLRDGSYFKPSQLQQGQVPSNGASGKRPPVASFFQ